LFVSAAKPTTSLGHCKLFFDKNSNMSTFLL